MSAEVTVALVGVTLVVLVLFTYAAFRYVPMTLTEEEAEEPTESRELRDEEFAG